MDNIKWLIQEQGFQRTNGIYEIESLEKLSLPFDFFDLFPSRHSMSNLEKILTHPEQQFIIRGGTQLLKLLSSINSLAEINPHLNSEQLELQSHYIQQLTNGIFYTDRNFDQAYYGALELPLLNKDAQLFSIKDNLHLKFDHEVFLKPSKDQKAFTAGILEAGETIHHFIRSQIHNASYIDETAVIAPCKKIIAEYRFFVVNKEIITGSRYRFADRHNMTDIIPHEIKEAATEYAKLYQPHDIFTMDLAETPHGISIIEYNCWNASAMYQTDAVKIFHTVHEFISQRPNFSLTNTIN